jgi:hypothetical protein
LTSNGYFKGGSTNNILRCKTKKPFRKISDFENFVRRGLGFLSSMGEGGGGIIKSAKTVNAKIEELKKKTRHAWIV